MRKRGRNLVERIKDTENKLKKIKHKIKLLETHFPLLLFYIHTYMHQST